MAPIQLTPNPTGNSHQSSVPCDVETKRQHPHLELEDLFPSNNGIKGSVADLGRERYGLPNYSMYDCPRPGCAKSFKLRKDLNRHLNTKFHVNESPACYQCCCGKEFRRKDHFTRHYDKKTKKCPKKIRFGCTCGFNDHSWDRHLAHIHNCGRKKRGRPVKDRTSLPATPETEGKITDTDP